MADWKSARRELIALIVETGVSFWAAARAARLIKKGRTLDVEELPGVDLAVDLVPDSCGCCWAVMVRGPGGSIRVD